MQAERHIISDIVEPDDEDDEPGDYKQFSAPVIKYQKEVEDIIAWLLAKEEELQDRTNSATLNESTLEDILKEYGWHETFISEICEYCQTIMRSKEDGQEMRDDYDNLTDEDRDEIGIQMDTMIVCYEKLKILAHDRLRELQELVETRQNVKIEQFEEWLSSMELRTPNWKNVEPDYDAIQRQVAEMNELKTELEQKQDFLNFMSSVIIFDEVDSTLQVRRRSSESLDDRLERINRRWSSICKSVDDRLNRLRIAESIWRLLNFEGPQLRTWLRMIERQLSEMSDAARSQTTNDTPEDKAFIKKLMSRSDKIDAEIKGKQSFYTGLEHRVRNEIDKYDDPCSMLVIELEKKLEDMQDDWNSMMNKKRMLDYSLQALYNPTLTKPETFRNMIPLPDPITTANSNDLQFVACSSSPSTEYSPSTSAVNYSSKHKAETASYNESSPPMQGSSTSSDLRAYDNSISSDIKPADSSLLSASRDQTEQAASDDELDVSHNDLSSTSMTTAQILADLDDQNHRYEIPKPVIKDANHTSSQKVESNEDSCTKGSHNCRVEHWRQSLDLFSNWLRSVESSLRIDHIAFDIQDDSTCNRWLKLDVEQQLNILTDVEQQIVSTHQDKFDQLIALGQQISQDLIPEINENLLEANLKKILADVEIRFATVKRCLSERKQKLLSKGRWFRLLGTLRTMSDYIIGMLDSIMPEFDIGVDLITLAQQQDQLIHLKADLEQNRDLTSCKNEAQLFLRLCNCLMRMHQQQYDDSPIHHREPIIDSTLNSDSIDASLSSQPTNIRDIWSSFKDLREDIESQLDRLNLHQSELYQLIDERLARLDEVQKEMHALQHQMQELAAQLQLAEVLKSNWLEIDASLSIDQLSEQLEDLKLYRDRLVKIESIHSEMSATYDWMLNTDVPLSQQNIKRLEELNAIWASIESSVQERQKQIEQAFDNQGASEQKFLQQSLNDMPNWERRVATTSKVPYFVNHETNKTSWDHPKFEDIIKSMSTVQHVVFAAYRTALKLHIIQKRLRIDLLMLEQIKDILDMPLEKPTDEAESKRSFIPNEATLISVEQIISFLKIIYEKIQSEEDESLDVPLAIDLTLNWLLNLYDSTRTGYISALSFKVGLALLCCATREEKHIYMFELVAHPQTGTIDARKLGTILELCVRIPAYLNEADSFGGTDIVEVNVWKCFSKARYNPQRPNHIDLGDYLSWLKTEPQFISWLPVLHRILISQDTTHLVKCNICKVRPIKGLRYKCLRCFKYNVCQNCFLNGRHISEHGDPIKHPMHEYCCASKSGENIRDFTKILRNKLDTRTTKSKDTRQKVNGAPHLSDEPI